MILDDDKLAGILEPIDGGVGADARVTDDDGLAERFRELRSQRKAIFRDEQRMSMGGDPSESDCWSWEELAEHAIEFLRDDAKDLEPMAMVIEASVRDDGLPGLDAAMNLTADLIEKFWSEGLYPPEDEDDGVEARFQPLSGLSGGSNDKEGTLIMPLRRMVLARGGRGDICFIDRIAAENQFASAQRADPSVREEQVRQAEEAFAAFDSNALTAQVPALKAAIAHLERAEAGWRRGVDYIIGQTKPLMPAASRVTEELRKMREWLSGVLKKLPDVDDGAAVADAAVEAGEAPAAAGAAPVKGGPLVIGQLNTREDALRAIGAAAEYFERIEPHSPFGNTLREVDRRARMNLNALLEELIPDGQVRQDYYWRAGIKPPVAE